MKQLEKNAPDSRTPTYLSAQEEEEEEENDFTENEPRETQEQPDLFCFFLPLETSFIE